MKINAYFMFCVCECVCEYVVYVCSMCVCVCENVMMGVRNGVYVCVCD